MPITTEPPAIAGGAMDKKNINEVVMWILNLNSTDK